MRALRLISPTAVQGEVRPFYGLWPPANPQVLCGAISSPRPLQQLHHPRILQTQSPSTLSALRLGKQPSQLGAIASECASHTYAEVLRRQLGQGLRVIAKAKPDKKLTWEAELTLLRFLTGHASTGKYTQRFHAERAISFAYECGSDPQTVITLCSTALVMVQEHMATPSFNFDDRRIARSIKRLCRVLRNANHTNALLRI